jgi:hypothetical protein
MLRPVKDKLGLKVIGIYCLPCECCMVGAGQTGKDIQARCKEHTRYACLNQMEKSAVVEHRFQTGHNIDFSGISILDKATGFMDQILKEATKIRLHANNFNRNGGFILSHSW